MRDYTTRTEAIQREIADAIEAGDARATEYDIEAIARDVLGPYEEGYAVVVDDDEFWASVERHAFESDVPAQARSIEEDYPYDYGPDDY